MKTLVLYYSSYGHTETIADALAEGAKKVAGNTVDIKRVPETLPEEVREKMHFKKDWKHEVIGGADELKSYDALIIGTPTRYGRPAAQMAAFLDQTGGLWSQNALVGKVASTFTSTATQHGGNELTLISMIANLMHLGCVIVGLPYSAKGQMTIDELSGGSPYGVSTIAGGQGQRQPSKNELELARFQGEHVATIASKLAK